MFDNLRKIQKNVPIGSKKFEEGSKIFEIVWKGPTKVWKSSKIFEKVRNSMRIVR